MDISSLSLNDDGAYEITYCALYDYCLTELNDTVSPKNDFGIYS